MPPLSPRRLHPLCHPAVDAPPLASARRAGAAPRGSSVGAPPGPPHSPPPSRGAILGLPRPRSGGRPRPRVFAALPCSVPPCAWGRRAVLSLPLRCFAGGDFPSSAWADPFRSHLSCQPGFPARILCRSSIFPPTQASSFEWHSGAFPSYRCM